MKNEWDKWARYYDSDLNSWLDINEDFIIKNIDFTGKSILDIGAGTGNLALKMVNKSKSITLLEPSERMIMITRGKLKKYDNITFINKSLENFKSKNRFDIIILSDVLHHINYKNLASKIQKFLKKRGNIVIVEPLYLKPGIFIKNIFYNNFKRYGFKRGFKMLKTFFIPRVFSHLTKEKYLKKYEIVSLFNGKIIKESIINDSFYFLMLKNEK